MGRNFFSLSGRIIWKRHGCIKLINPSFQFVWWLLFREPAGNIPPFILSYYKKTGNGAIPTPKVGGSRKQGSATQYELVWSGDDNLREWVPEQDLINLDEAEVPVSETRNCNTRKDKDKRKNRHTCGIFIGYFYFNRFWGRVYLKQYKVLGSFVTGLISVLTWYQRIDHT